MKHLVRLAVVLAISTVSATAAWAGSSRQVAAGSNHTCALTPEGGVVCWGANFFGQLGNGTTIDSLTPIPVSGLGSGVTAIAAGGYRTCALTAAGGVLCWGFNEHGEVGDGTTDTRLTPTPVSGLARGVVAITAGPYHTCALSELGAVACWGVNSHGALGDGTTTDHPTPMPVSGLGSGVAAVSAGAYHTCAQTAVGAVLCWGANWYGQLGNDSTNEAWTPTPVVGLGSGVTAIASGWDHTCALTAAGALVCWGSNWFGALGDGTITDRWTPTPVAGLESGVVSVAAGTYHTCALTTAGGVLCWGALGYAGFGDMPVPDLTPTPVSGFDTGVAGIAAGSYHACLLTTAGGAACWGYNGEGQIGDGTTADRTAPTGVAGFEGRSFSVSDFDGDGVSDILWHHTARGEVWLWPMAAGQQAASLYVATVGEPGWEIRGLGDQTGDGQADLLWRHGPTGMLYLWAMNGSVAEAETYVGTVDPAFDIVGTGDYNGDGRSDILWRNLTDGQVWLWLMNGPSTLSVTYVDTVDLAYEVKGSADLNADWKADIVWQGSAGDVWVWLMDGPVPKFVKSVSTVPDLEYRIVGVADHTGDGRADLLWHHATYGEVWLWSMNGTALMSQSQVDTVPDTGYGVAGTGDYDGAGKADMLWHHATRGEVWAWLMNGSTKLSEHYVGTVPDTGYQIVRGR